MKTAEGAVEYSAPQVRDTPEPFVSSVRSTLSGRTRELERLAVELYARGLSTRDIEDAFTDETGKRLLSRAAVSEVTEHLWAEYEDFCERDLSEHAFVYVFVDGIAERLRPGQRREAVLAAWGIGEDGRNRGLGDPLLVVSDGAPGIIRAIEECFPRSARQRRLAHWMRRALLVSFNASVHSGPQSMSTNDDSVATREFSSEMEGVFRRPVPIVSQSFSHNSSTAPTCPVALPSPARAENHMSSRQRTRGGKPTNTGLPIALACPSSNPLPYASARSI